MFRATVPARGDTAETFCGITFEITPDDIRLPDDVWDQRPELCSRCARIFRENHAMRR